MSLCYFWILGQIIINNFRCFSCSLRSFEVILKKIIQLRSKVNLKCNSSRRRCNNTVTDVLLSSFYGGLWTMTDSEEGKVLKPPHRTLFLANSPFQIKLSSVPCTILLHFTRIITCNPPTQTLWDFSSAKKIPTFLLIGHLVLNIKMSHTNYL